MTSVYRSCGNIALIGFMGSGKTTCGWMVARDLGFEQVDMDRVIEENNKCSISKIFEKQGELYFRDLETQLIGELVQQKGLVISTGGGIVKRPTNMELLAKSCFIVYLETDIEDILAKLGNDKSRPLLNTENKEQTIATLLAERVPLYEKYCDAKVIIPKRSINDISNDIIKQYKENWQGG